MSNSPDSAGARVWQEKSRRRPAPPGGAAYFFSLVQTLLRSDRDFGEQSLNGRRRSSLSAGVLIAGSSNSALSMNFSAPAMALLYLAKLEAAAMFSGCIIQLMNTWASATLVAPLGITKLSMKV